MRLKSVKVENFKAIEEADIELSDVTILVGQNSSGKSSFLQALHWACRCVADSKIQNNQSRSVAIQSLDYFPTLDAKVVGHNKELREGRGPQPEVSVFVTLVCDDENHSKGIIPIKRGRNDAIQIDLQKEKRLPTSLYLELSNRTKPFSAYIPGLAGIPSSEEKKSRQPIFRSAASGDANSVLRNILLLIQENSDEDIKLLEHWVSKVLGPTRILIEFDHGNHFEIQAQINTEKMEAGIWSPLDLAGTGVLQVIQIFAYLILFRPSILLIDEPDAHLHPDRQEKLIRAIEEAATDFATQIILTTHSPHIIRISSSKVNLAWLADGGVAQDQIAIREQMGWGLLDKSHLIITEDANTPILQSIIDQWPEFRTKTAIWPVFGSENLPSAEGAKALKSMLGIKRLIVHRDADFMLDVEKNKLLHRFEGTGCDLWITRCSDLEGYLCTPEHIAWTFDISEEAAHEIAQEAENRSFKKVEFTEKRSQINKNNRFYPGGAGTPSYKDAKDELNSVYAGHTKGKDMLKCIKSIVHKQLKRNGEELLYLPENGDVADDLKEILQE